MPRTDGTTIVAPRGRGTPGGVGGGNGDGKVPLRCRTTLKLGVGPRSPIIWGMPPDEVPASVPYAPGWVANADDASSGAKNPPASARAAVGGTNKGSAGGTT